MITVDMQRRVAKVQNAQAALEKAIFDRMDVLARRMHLEQIVITHLGNAYHRGDGEVASKQLDELDDLYGDHVHAGGFEACWTPEKGWDA
jgi:hypothetical protein